MFLPETTTFSISVSSPLSDMPVCSRSPKRDPLTDWLKLEDLLMKNAISRRTAAAHSLPTNAGFINFRPIGPIAVLHGIHILKLLRRGTWNIPALHVHCRARHENECFVKRTFFPF